MRIFYPTDFSDASLNAFVYALHLAKAHNASIITFHAYRIPDIRGANLPSTLRQVYDSISLELFEDYRDSIPLLRKISEEQGCSDVEMSHILQQGEPKDAILKAIEANRIDMVVMGTTGAGMMKELFVGSVAAEVMENASVPVLAVPLGAAFEPPLDRIAFASEMLEEDYRALPKVQRIAEALGAKVFCINADVSHSIQYTDKKTAFQEKFPGVELYIVDSIDAESSIKAFVKSHSIDILAMLIHKRNKIQELLTYSMTKRLARHLKVPVLAIQAHTLED